MDIIKLVHKALSDSDIRAILGENTKIIKYSELSNYRDLDDLLPNLLDYIIILYEHSPNEGHWVGLLKYNNIFEFFDPYGYIVDKPLTWVNLKTRRPLNELTPYLSNLLKQERYIYNQVKYQDEDSYVFTCGSHVTHRIYRLIKNNMNLEQYHEFMKNLKNESKINYDLIVATFIQLKLKDY